MAKMSYMEASRQAVIKAMHQDKNVWCVGEDLGRGGVFGQYKGLVEEFGPQRISDTPISENCIMGAAFGAAMVGTRPIVEMRFSDFALCAIDELVNQIAKARFMFGGQSRAPMVIREPIGMWRSSAAQHSQSLESWYTHIPGLVVVCPSSPQDNFSLLTAAIACDDPVVYMEHKDYWALEGDVDLNANPIQLGKANKLKTGDDLTIISWSGCVHQTLAAAEILAQSGIHADVIDLRSLWPWDKSMVLESVRRTGRIIVAHEAVSVGGFGAEIISTVAERACGALKAAPVRLGSPRSLIAYAPNLENKLRVTDVMIADAAQTLLKEQAA